MPLMMNKECCQSVVDVRKIIVLTVCPDVARYVSNGVEGASNIALSVTMPFVITAIQEPFRATAVAVVSSTAKAVM